MKQYRTRVTRCLAAGGAALALALGNVPAHAETSVATQTDPALLGTGAADMQALSERYGSLSGALTAFYADQKGQTVSQFISENPAQAAKLLGVQTQQQLDELPTDQVAVDAATGRTDVAALNRQLAASGLALDTQGYDDLDAAANAVAANASSVDAAVISAGSSWAAQMAGLRTPALTTPNAPGVSTKLATAMPKEGLVFGMFLDKSLTAMVTDFPDVFSQVQQTGVGTAASQQAWNTSMQRALTASREDFSTMLPSQCAAGMLSVMASGNAADARKYGDSSGAAAGLYLHSQLSRLFDPASTSTVPNSSDNVMNPTEWNRLQDFQKDMILKQNPDLGASLKENVSGSAVTGCTTSKAATSGALSTTLPGVFSNLMK